MAKRRRVSLAILNIQYAGKTSFENTLQEDAKERPSPGLSPRLAHSAALSMANTLDTK